MSTVEAELMPQPETQALAVRQQPGAVGRAMTLDELHSNLDFIRQVMAREMKENQDYGKVPGCGDKPGLFQPGAQKLLMTFQLTDHVKQETVKEHPNFHREYAFIVTVRSQTGREWDGVGTCCTLEAKYRYRSTGRRCPLCHKETILKSKQGDGWFCWVKKGGCGANFASNDPTITGLQSGRTEHDNPADHWNTCRKMAFKRALVHAAINATNTSELWSQDLEDLAANNATAAEPEASFEGAATVPPAKPAATPKPAAPKPTAPASAPAGVRRVAGIIEKVTEKTGTSARGEWTKFGVKLGDAWFNTFDKKLGEAAKTLEGSKAVITFSSNERGNTIVTLTTDPPPAAPEQKPDPNDDVPF